MTPARPRSPTRAGLLAGLVVLALTGLAVVGAAGASPSAAASSGVDGAHGNHLSTDAQVVADGAVLVESLFLLSDGYLVIRADDGGDPGEPIGHRAVDSGFQRAVVVDTDRSFWADRDGPVRVHATLHSDDGDGEFDVEDDPVMRSPATGRAVSTFTAAPGEEPAHLSARAFSGQSVDGPAVTIRRAAVPADAELVVHRSTVERTLGERLGSRTLSAGTHGNVTVPIDESAYEDLPADGGARLWATIHVDGDPLTVGGEPVRTLFEVRPSNGSDDEWSINTPVPTTGAGAPGETTAGATDQPDDSGTTTDSGSGGAPGFGLGVAVAVLLGLALLLVGRRSRA